MKPKEEIINSLRGQVSILYDGLKKMQALVDVRTQFS